MRWFCIRKANINQSFREHFEELGVEIVRAYFTQPIGTPVWKDVGENAMTVATARNPMQLWLREQYDLQERRETWNLAMEVAITLLVAVELAMSVLTFIAQRSK